MSARRKVANQEPNIVEEVIEQREGRPPLVRRYDRTRFPSALKADRYENLFQNQAIVYERTIELLDFTELGIYANMEARGCNMYLRNGGDVVKELGREFYSNTEIVNGAINTYVRVAHINVDEDYIAEGSYHEMGVEWIGLSTFAFGERWFFRQAELADKYKMLNLIVVSNPALIGLKNEILTEKAQLLYEIDKNQSIDLPSLILTEMIKGCDAKRNSLPFGKLVTEICLDWGVKVRQEMGVLKPMGSLNKVSFQMSQGHNRGPTARQDVPCSDEVQDVLDAKEERGAKQAQVETSTGRTLQDIMLDIEAKQDEILQKKERRFSIF